VTKPLVVVESPTKVRTIKKIIGDGYNVVATVGHLRDLPEKEMGIDVDDDFKPKYRNIPGKQKVIRSLKQSAGDADEIYLAPDPDREGEAIAWHVSEILKKKNRTFHRVLFHELTASAIRKAISSPIELNQNKYEAQQTRRILDRLVGYQISPLLWRKVKGGLSAGRVQSVALRILCERERAIQAFEPEEYWSITAHLSEGDSPHFSAKLVRKNGEKLRIPDQAASDGILAELAGKPFRIEKVIKKTTKRNPLPPFTTSKLQQEAIRKLRFSAKKAMMVAQQLYEGIDLGPGDPVGLITYMRTDSTRFSAEAAAEAGRLVLERFGASYALAKPRFFKNRKKVQDAHEAIRPTDIFQTPEKLAPFLKSDQLALYQLIWQRFVASQMKEAKISNITASIQSGDYTFTASGSSVLFPGFMALYTSSDDDAADERGKKKPQLPDLQEGSTLTLHELEPKQHFTMPPPRFSEASLVKELEENGIGRPSTYAAIMSTIRGKEYVSLLKGYFHPNELGFIVNDLLVANFPDIFNVEFTAKMEDDLDRVESGDVGALQILKRFYSPFEKELSEAADGMLSVKGVGFSTPLQCPECGNTLHIKMGKNGHFLACNGYPACSYSRDYTRDEKGNISPVEITSDEAVDKACEKCGSPMAIKRGRYGEFLACIGYPECKFTLSLNASSNGNPIGVKCPRQGCEGEIVEKKSRRGKIFFGCGRYPECDFASWNRPVDKPCPVCGATFLVEKTTKREGTFLTCITEDCGYREDL
jgi:DNA topoisomerase-1